MASSNSTTSSGSTFHHKREGFGSQPLRDSLSFILSLVVGAAASASGIGGGAIYVPLLDVVEGLGPRAATATSQVAVAAGSLAAVAARWKRRHPADPQRPIVDWQMAAVLQPPLLLGVSAGILANHALPSWGITLSLILFLSLMSLDTCLRALRLHRKETEAREGALEAAMEEAEAEAEAEGEGDGDAEARVAGAAVATGATAPAATTTAQQRQHRPMRPSSSSYAMSMASLGTGSFLEDIFSAGVSRMPTANSPRDARASKHARRTQSMSAVPSGSSPREGPAGSFRRRFGGGPSFGANKNQQQHRPVPRSRSAAAVFHGAARRAFSLFHHRSRADDKDDDGGGDSIAAAAAAAVAAADAAGAAGDDEEEQNEAEKDEENGLENEDGGSFPGFAPAYSSLNVPRGGGEDDVEDVSSLDIAFGSADGGGSNSRHSGSLRSDGAGQRRAATPPPPLLFPVPPLSPRTEGARTATSSPVPPLRPAISPLPSKAMETKAETEQSQPLRPRPPPLEEKGRLFFSRFFSPRALASNGAAAAQLLLLFAAMTALQVVRSLALPCSTRWVAATATQAGVAALATAVSIGAALAGAARGDTLPASAADAAVADLYGAEPERTPGRLLVAAGVSLVAGVIAALLGIGGGTVVVPLLLALKVHPQCAAATSTVLILFSSTTAAAGQGAAGYIHGTFAAAFGVAALGAGAAGVLLSAKLVDKSGRSSILVWMLAVVIAAGAIVTAALGGKEAVRDLRSGENKVKGFCA